MTVSTASSGNAAVLDPDPERCDNTRPSAAPQRRRRIRVALSVTGLIAFAILVTKRAEAASSIGRLGHPHWSWIPIALVLESASMATFAWMQRRLLRVGGMQVGNRPMLATTFAANALSVSVPVAGPELGAAFSFRRFMRQGADPSLASWSLVAGGLVSVVGAIAILVGGGALSGSTLVTGASVGAGLLVLGAAAGARATVLSPRFGPHLERPAAWAVGRIARLCSHPIDDPQEAINTWLLRVRSFRLSPSEWIKVGGWGLANWLTDAGVLAIGILAVGAPVPWRALLLVYGAATVVGSVGITPGGIGLVEGTLCLGLVSAGLPAGQALVAVLLYRVVSFWLVAAVGWFVLLYLRLERTAHAASIQGAVAP
jgi:putative heme transporter